MNEMQELLVSQLALQVGSYDVDPTSLSADERKTYVLWNAFALCDEVHEALREVAWKPWSTGEKFNRDQFVDELIDVLFFWLNLMLVANVTGDEIVQAYKDKRAVNAARQRDGYTG